MPVILGLASIATRTLSTHGCTVKRGSAVLCLIAGRRMLVWDRLAVAAQGLELFVTTPAGYARRLARAVLVDIVVPRSVTNLG